MPSGVSNNDQYSIKLSDCGTKLFLEIDWPSDLTDKNILVKIGQLKDPDLTLLHPSVSGINSALRQLTEKINEIVSRKYYINIPIKVEQVIKILTALTTQKGATLVHVRLQGITDTYVQNVQQTGSIVKADF